MEIKSVINIEDTMLKHSAIARSLRKNGVSNIDLAKNAEEGLDKIEMAIQAGTPYDLLITDMHFSVKGRDDINAGLYVINELKIRGIEIPIIVCSSVRYKIDGIIGCIFYNERSGDIDSDIREMLDKVRFY